MLLTTPHRPQNDLSRFIAGLNGQFNLDIPTLGLHSPSTVRTKSSLRWRCISRLRFLYFKDQNQLRRAVNSLEEWIVGQPTPVYLSDRDKDDRMRFLLHEIEDDVYLLSRAVRTSLG